MSEEEQLFFSWASFKLGFNLQRLSRTKIGVSLYRRGRNHAKSKLRSQRNRANWSSDVQSSCLQVECGCSVQTAGSVVQQPAAKWRARLAHLKQKKSATMQYSHPVPHITGQRSRCNYRRGGDASEACSLGDSEKRKRPATDDFYF